MVMIKRESYLNLLREVKDTNLIKVITGLRGSGKSTLLSQFRNELELNKEKVIFYNLEEKENELFLKDADALYNQIMSEVDENRKNYIFIDEVQLVPDFERMLDSLYVKSYTDIYVTGSNAYMLSSDIATLLTGRSIKIEMQPLSFSEFLQFFDPSNNKQDLFQKYLLYGGLPEVANLLTKGAESTVSIYLKGVYETILEKDVKMRKNIRNMDDFKRVYAYCLDNIGNITSPNNIANVLNSNHHSIDHKTIDDYLRSLTDCYLLCSVKRYDIRGKDILRTGEKYYSIDMGLVSSLLGRGSVENYGHRLENIVYLELKKRYHDVWIGKNYNKEIDFVVRNHDGEMEYYQVSQSIADLPTRERELSALKNTGDYYKKTVLTLDIAETSEKGIVCRNLLAWLEEK